MFLSKKIAKFNKGLKPSSNPDSPPKTKDTERKKILKCRFQLVPIPIKFIPTNKTFLLYGDIPVIKSQDNLVFDLGLFNEFMVFQGIVTNIQFNQTVLNIKPTRKLINFLPPWAEFVRELETLRMPEWAETVKIYCQKYEKVMKRQSRKKAKTDARKKYFVQATGETEEKKRRLFEQYPCLLLKYRLKDHQNQLNEVVFSENMIVSMGHTIESFASKVLQEGIPQFSSFDNIASSQVLQSILSNYFALEGEKREVMNLNSVLLMNDGFVRDIVYQVDFLMNYETNTFGLDVIFAITSQGEPYPANENTQIPKINPGFTEFMSGVEHQASHFLIEYYQEFLSGLKKNSNKMGIEEGEKNEDVIRMEEEEDLLVKDQEDKPLEEGEIIQ